MTNLPSTSDSDPITFDQMNLEERRQSATVSLVNYWEKVAMKSMNSELHIMSKFMAMTIKRDFWRGLSFLLGWLLVVGLFVLRKN